MNNKICVLMLMLLMLCCSGCSANSSDDSSSIERRENNNTIDIYVDKETGVNYLVYNAGYQGGMTVRLNADGTPYVSSGEEIENE